MPFLDALTPAAEAIGAVNTIVSQQDGSLLGDNTDARGLVADLHDHGIDPAGSDVLLLGAGGSARAAAFGLAESGAASVTIFNRTVERADALSDAMCPRFPDCTWQSGSARRPQAPCARQSHCELHLARHGARRSVRCRGTRTMPFRRDQIVYDLVYNPTPTRLTEFAAQCAARVPSTARECWSGRARSRLSCGPASRRPWTSCNAPSECADDDFAQPCRRVTLARNSSTERSERNRLCNPGQVPQTPDRQTVNYDAYPDESGHFGPYGGKFVPETLMPALDELEEAYLKSVGDRDFQEELAYLQRTYVGRPTPVTYARRLSEHLGGAQIYLKREDLAHTGAHKINNALGQALLMKRKMGKTRIVAETGAGQHGVATATAAALLGIECVVYMGTVDMARQEPNVFRMRLAGHRGPRRGVRQQDAEGRHQRGDSRLGSSLS